MRVDGAVPALLAAQRSGGDAAGGISKDLWGSIGKNPTLKMAAMEALRADVERAGWWSRRRWAGEEPEQLVLFSTYTFFAKSAEI